MILKGGPGCGKSTFMRRVGAAMERAGERVVYINCSGDPDSLDGAIFLDRNAAIVDGTSPHGTAPLGHHTKKRQYLQGFAETKILWFQHPSWHQ